MALRNMPIVTKLSPQKNKIRVNVEIDGKYGFGIDLENLMKWGIKVGVEYSHDQINQMIEKGEYQKVLNKLLSFASLRPRSSFEINQWFNRKKVVISFRQELVNKLQRLDFLDDAKFAAWWVEQRMQFKPRGIRALKLELLQKGIDREVIDNVLSKYTLDDTKVLSELYERSKTKWERLSGEKRKQKVFSYFLRKGFSLEVIKKIINE